MPRSRTRPRLAWLNIGQSLITNVMMAGAMGFVVWGWSKGRFSTGDVVVVNTLLAQLFRPLDLLGMVYRTIRQGLIDMDAMFALIDTPAEVVDAPGAPDLQVAAGHVRFEDVHFGYEPGARDPEGHRSRGEAGHDDRGGRAVGRRQVDPVAAAVPLLRAAIAAGSRSTARTSPQVTQKSLRAALGIVPQDTVLFNDTIGYNIGYGRDGAGQAEIEAAAQRRGDPRFHRRACPQGYEAMVGERGLKLSGGEKQRVAIARTLLKDPPILILDEATSALDSRTEAAIQETLQGVAARRTSIVIAHRLSTVVDADQIVVLDQGRVAERGTHAQLLRKNGLYAEMWARQQSEREEEEAQAAE